MRRWTCGVDEVNVKSGEGEGEMKRGNTLLYLSYHSLFLQ